MWAASLEGVYVWLGVPYNWEKYWTRGLVSYDSPGSSTPRILREWMLYFSRRFGQHTTASTIFDMTWVGASKNKNVWGLQKP